MIVRCGLVADFMTHLRMNGSSSSGSSSSSTNDSAHSGSSGSATMLSEETSLRLLACIPPEMETCQDMTTSDVSEELVVHLEIALDKIQKGLVAGGQITTTTRLPACQALQTWAHISHVTLSQLNSPTCGGTYPVLPTLISLLSSSSLNGVVGPSSPTSSMSTSPSNALPYDEMTLISACRALTDIVMVVSDHCTPSRDEAACVFWKAIPEQGFIIHPLQVATYNEWNDASHALGSLISTFVIEQVDDLVAQPSDIGLQLLLDIQKHPHTPVALVPLECWLTIQEVPMSERHEDWKRPLYRQLVETLVTRLEYPENFTTWEDELDVDSSEFFEFRRLVSDVLTSCYFLLRVEMVQMLIHQVRVATHWTKSEAAFFGLETISKDVCARCRSNASSGTMVGRDRQATCQELLQLLDQLITVNITPTQRQHPLFLAAVVNFCGSYSPAWHSMNCPPHAILQLLAYLHTAFFVLPISAAKATRAIYVSCLSKSMPNLEDLQSEGTDSWTGAGEGISSSQSIVQTVLRSIRDSMEAVLLTTDEEAMTTVAEGAIRLVAKLADPTIAREAMKTDLVQPVLRHIEIALQRLPEAKINSSVAAWNSPQAQSAMDILERCLSVIEVIARYCDSPHIPAMGEWFQQEVGPCLETVQRRTACTPAQSLIIPKWILIHQQILRNSLLKEGAMMNTIPLMVNALEQTKEPNTLKYISTAVEMFGGKTPGLDQSFQDLLSHVTTVVASDSNLQERSELLQAYMECLQRFILFCPRSLCYNPQFATIVSLSVECISLLQGKESTRAALLFLSQLFGCNSLRLSQQTHQVMQEAWNVVIKDKLLIHSPVLTSLCVAGLAGGSQMLWPAYSDCLFAIVQALVWNQQQEEYQVMINPAADEPSSSSPLSEAQVHHWLYSSMILHLNNDENSNDREHCSNINSSSSLTIGTINQVISILFKLAREGPKSRPKAKMLLTDFAKIKKGEMGVDVLLSYTLP